MQLSPRALELHKQEQNLFQLIELFNKGGYHFDNPEAEQIWILIQSLESKTLTEETLYGECEIDYIFLAIQMIKANQDHPSHGHIATWLSLLPPYVNKAFSRWLIAQEQVDVHSYSHRNPQVVVAGAGVAPQQNQEQTQQSFITMGNTIFVPGQFDETFIVQFNSLCESVGIAQATIKVSESKISITVPEWDKMETYTVVLESVLLAQKLKEENETVSFREFVVL